MLLIRQRPSLYVFIMIIMVMHCSSAAAEPALHQEAGPLLHTFVEVKAFGGDEAERAVHDVFTEMARINNLLNNYDQKSDVARINAAAGGTPVAVSPETFNALTQARQLARLSGGAFDFTVGPLLALWGFNREVPGLAGSEPTSDQIAAAKRLVDYSALTFTRKQSAITAQLAKSGMWIDVGAFSKGFVADRAIAFLKQRNIRNALVAAGGTICAIGSKPNNQPWSIGIRHPRNDDSFLTVITPGNQCVSTSGDYEKFYVKRGKRRSHIIDPRSGTPVSAMQSVTVIAPNGAESDALATALFVLGPVDGLQLVENRDGVEALLVSAGGRVVYSKGWPQKTIVY